MTKIGAKLVLWYRTKLQEFQQKDVFWLLDYLNVLGGSFHNVKGAWRVTFWCLYQLLAFYQFCIEVLAVVSNVSSWEDQTTTIWSMMSLTAMVLSIGKQFLLWHYREPVQKLKKILSEKQFSSGDSSFDAKVRSGFHQNGQNLVIGIFGLIVADQIMIAVPNSLRTRWFGIPRWMYFYGERAAFVIELAFYPSFIIVWVSKLFCCSATIAILLVGLRAELEILANYYKSIFNNLQKEIVLEQAKFMRRYRKSPQVRSWFWNQLKLRTGTAVQHHIHLLENLRLLQPIFEKIFFLIYYQSLIVAGTVLYLIMRDEFTPCSVAVLMCMSTSVLECYWWCHLVDSFQGVNESIAETLLNQCSQLPHSDDHHSEYVQMRSTCMIVAERARHGVVFSCVGMFKISTAVFVNLLNFCYSVLMFLMNVCDNADPVKQFQMWVGSKMN